MSTEQESIFCQEMDVLGDNLEGKSATFTSLCEWIYSELDKLAQPSFRYQELGSSALTNTSRFVQLVCWLMRKPRHTHFAVGLRACRF